jgi:hypothetical protein
MQLRADRAVMSFVDPDPSQACVLFPEVDTLCVISACGGEYVVFRVRVVRVCGGACACACGVPPSN